MPSGTDGVLIVVAVELLEEPLSFAQEIIVKVIKEIRIMNKTFFIFSSIPKVKYYWLE